MDQSERYYQYLERLTREMVSPEQIRVETVYEDLRELCKMLRVSKGVTAFYSSLSHERKGQGDIYIPYDNGSETDKARKGPVPADIRFRKRLLNLWFKVLAFFGAFCYALVSRS